LKTILRFVLFIQKLKWL